MWFALEPSDLGFTERSPFRLETEVMIDASPERVFEIFATGEAQAEWFQDFVACHWTTPEPHGVGATRDVELKMLSVKERFLAWDPGKRLSFAITAITLPLVRRMVEDLRFEASGDRTRLLWVAHYEPRTLMRLVHPVARMVFGRLFRNSAKQLARYAGRHPKKA